jgi:hypothetical protein
MASFFKPVCDIEIRLDGEDARDMVEFKIGGKERKEKAPLYKDGESVKGSVIVRPKDGKKLEHTGIKVNLIGSIGRPSPLYILTGQKCIMIEERITSFYLYYKNSLLQER